MRPTPSDVNKIIELLNDGFGFVDLYRFAFFGFRKDLINRIGFFDERFIGGGYEDSDFLRRVIESNIAYYDAECITYFFKSSTWDNSKSVIHFEKKWEHDY